jgi:hypothetical protein
MGGNHDLDRLAAGYCLQRGEAVADLAVERGGKRARTRARRSANSSSSVTRGPAKELAGAVLLPRGS